METYQSLANVDEEDLLDELPERRLSLYRSDKISLCESNKDDSGLGISDSLDTLKDGGENHYLEELSCETNDVDSKSLPELIPLSDMALSPNVKINRNKLSTNSGVNTSNAENLPELQPIPDIILDERKNSLSDDNSNMTLHNESRRSSTSSFIDSLLDKLRRNYSESSASDISPKKTSSELKTSDDDLLVEMGKSISYTKSSNPNMLPTPVVENQSISSVFVNSAKEYEEAIKRNKQKNCTGQVDKSKMTAKSQPPQMKPPKFPSSIQHPRTLAQKRLLLANNLSFLMIEQESKIFRQIQRKMSGREVDYHLIDGLSEDEIPLKHGPWKALSWLRTEEGNYIQQYINIDGQNYKLTGSKGNHKSKFLLPQSCKPFYKYQTTSLRSVRCCEGGKVKKRIIDNLANVESIKKFILEGNLSPYKKLEAKTLCNQLCSIKPRPLSKKIEHINRNRKMTEDDEDSIFLDDYMKFKMPDIKLEVKPQNKIPLDPKAKQYLNEIIPYRDLNENWINFSLSALSTKEKSNDENGTFEFTIPYCDNKQHILVREIIKQKDEDGKIRKLNLLESSENFDDFKWTFAENCDKNDTLEMEIVDIIKDLSNSVCINLNDDIFTKNDPAERSSLSVAPIKAKEAIVEIASTSKNLKIDQSKKMLLELRRLNANVVKSDSSRVDDEEDIRRHALAHLAKDERELRPTVIVTDSDTVLLSNKKTETRRQKRAPKRYSDYTHSVLSDDNEKEVEFEPPKKIKPKELVDEPFKTKAQYNDTGMTHEEIKTLKEAVKKWIHVNVDIKKLENLEEIQPWCMLHNLYKCSCKTIVPKEIPRGTNLKDDKESANVVEVEKEESIVDVNKISEDSQNLSSKDNSVHDEDDDKEVEEIPSKQNDENSRRVLPMESEKPRKSICEVQENIDLEEENKENAPKMEILNISELVNGGIGPIYINIYDTKVNRLNQIFRSILNNKVALVYLDGLGYYLDMKKIDVMKLKFDEIREELEHPVFIIRPKFFNSSEESSKICGDFVSLLFKDDSELVKQIMDKGLLKEISRIIEIILQSVRKKIETQIGDEPNDFVKEQLSLITRDRSNSNSSVSSADTSPLHFNGKELERAPPPGFDTEMMKDFNRIFSMRMQKLCAIIRSNSLGLHPLDGYVNKFFIYKWNLLLQSFEEDLINIWQVRLTSEFGKNYFMYIITNTTKPPYVENADNENIINVRKLPLSNISILIKMVLLRIENSKTINMTVLLFGCKGYFRICGLLNSKENYFDGVAAKPTKQTHPRLTAKIQKVYNIWYGLKKANAIENSPTKQSSIKGAEQEAENEKMLNDKNESKAHDDENFSDVSKNNSKQPSTYKWFLFNISNDFSDIYIKQWKNYLSYKVIMDAISKARLKQQTIRILGPVNSAKDTPRIFALPNAPLKFRKEEDQNMTGNFLLFGPYLRESNSNLLLMQNVDGKMLLRDDYEQRKNIQRSSRTRCLWIYANSLKCVTDSHIECVQPEWFQKCDNIKRANGDDENLSDTKGKRTSKLKQSDEQSKKLKISSIASGLKKVL